MALPVHHDKREQKQKKVQKNIEKKRYKIISIQSRVANIDEEKEFPRIWVGGKKKKKVFSGHSLPTPPRSVSNIRFSICEDWVISHMTENLCSDLIRCHKSQSLLTLGKDLKKHHRLDRDELWQISYKQTMLEEKFDIKLISVFDGSNPGWTWLNG